MEHLIQVLEVNRVAVVAMLGVGTMEDPAEATMEVVDMVVVEEEEVGMEAKVLMEQWEHMETRGVHLLHMAVLQLEGIPVSMQNHQCLLLERVMQIHLLVDMVEHLAMGHQFHHLVLVMVHQMHIPSLIAMVLLLQVLEHHHHQLVVGDLRFLQVLTIMVLELVGIQMPG